MNGTPAPSLLGLGDNTVDIYIDKFVQYPGGNTVNVVVQARRAGLRASYLGCLGTDSLGDLIHGALLAEDVDVSHCRRIAGPNAWARIRHDGNERQFVGSTPGVRGRYGLTPADDAFIANHDAVHTSVHSELDADMARLRTLTRLLSYDASVHAKRDGVADALRHVDIAFISSPDPANATCLALLGWALTLGPRLAVVTRGAAGSIAQQGGTVWREAARPTDAVDTLGAGDAFIAGFLVATLEGGAPDRALAAAAVQASAACAVKGGFGHGVATGPGQPGWPEGT